MNPMHCYPEIQPRDNYPVVIFFLDPSAEVLKKISVDPDVSTDYLINGTTADLAAENFLKTIIYYW